MSSRTILSHFKVSTLNQVAFLCGIRIPGPKKERVEAIVRHLELLKRLPPKINILAIDVGIKNLSHCRSESVDIQYGTNKVLVNSWDTWNLHERYGERYEPVLGDNESMIEQKRYMSYLSNSLVRELVVDVKPQPDVIIVETQRTRSNNNSITLPNVLLNHTFENMFYANNYTLNVDRNRSLEQRLVIPMSSNSMATFWINRFITKASLSKNSKKLRTSLLFDWLGDPHGSPFSFDRISLPDEFSSLTFRQKSAAFFKAYNPNLNKIDDLVDSLLYNLTVKTQLSNLNELSLSLRREDVNLDEMVQKWNLRQLSYVSNLIEDLGLEVNKEFIPLIR